MPSGKLYNGDCLAVMKTMSENSVSSIVTDPPYGLKFMSKKWDYDVPSVEIWREALRVLKPGGVALIFAGSRTQHRMAVNIEDAGFILKDCIMWIYGSGFPKSTDISKQIDKKAGKKGTYGDYKSKDHAIKRKPGNERMHEGYQRPWRDDPKIEDRNSREYIPATPAAQLWNGYGTALKPAYEPIIVAMKPNDGTYANNALKYGVAGINIDGCRVGSEILPEQKAGQARIGTFERENMITPERQGRFPANIIHDGSDEVLNLFPETKSGGGNKNLETSNIYGGNSLLKSKTKGLNQTYQADQGSAARFFYCAKASKKERGEGNNHPTVKPLALMEYLVRLVTPPDSPLRGPILDPFLGSGTTGVACKMNGVSFIGIEKDTEHGYYQIAKNRISDAKIA